MDRQQGKFADDTGELLDRLRRRTAPTAFGRRVVNGIPKSAGGPDSPIFRLNQSLFERSQACERNERRSRKLTT